MLQLNQPVSRRSGCIDIHADADGMNCSPAASSLVPLCYAAPLIADALPSVIGRESPAGLAFPVDDGSGAPANNPYTANGWRRRTGTRALYSNAPVYCSHYIGIGNFELFVQSDWRAIFGKSKARSRLYFRTRQTALVYQASRATFRAAESALALRSCARPQACGPASNVKY